MVNKLIIRSSQNGMPCLFPKTTFVNQWLGMFHPKADGKWLRFDVHPPTIEHLKGIAGAVPYG